METVTCNLDHRILAWIEKVENREIAACKEQHLLASYIRKCFDEEEIYTDSEMLTKYLGLSKYFPYETVFEWEQFCIALHLCTFWKDDQRPRWPDLLLVIGRGAGKDGYIALESFALASPYSGLIEYDVDICANAEEQAMRPVNDILNVLEMPKHSAKLRKYYRWTNRS